MITKLYIENQLVDLYEGENINITSSVLDIQDISKNTTDYSNTFTVPASKSNNIIFKHYYNADIDNGYDARIKASARIEIGGEVFREGKIALKKVSLRNGKVDNYTLNFFGKLVGLKDILGTDKLKDLDFSEYTQDYDPAFIQALLTNNQTPYEISNSIPHRYDLSCALLSNKRLFYASNTDTYDTETESNLYYDATQTDNGVNWQELKPSFLIRSIIEQIEIDYDIEFTGGFFDKTMFDNLFLYLDNGSELKKTEGEETIVTVDTSTGTPTSKRHIGTSITAFAVNVPDIFTYNLRIEPISLYEDVEFTVKIYDNSTLIAQQTTSKVLDITLTFPYTTQSGNHSIEATIEPKTYITYYPDITVVQTQSGIPIYTEDATTNTPNVVTPKYIVADNMPDMTIIDFIKGLSKAFKLVIIPIDENTVYVNNVNEYYDEGGLVDLTKYVDISKIQISRADIFNHIKYKFNDPETILNKNYKGSTEEGYGDEQLYLYDEDGELIDGKKTELEVPFEQVMYERLSDNQTGEQTGIQYGAIIDDELKSKNIKPHIFYNVLRDIGANTIAFNDSTSTLIELSDDYYAPSHIQSDSAPGTAFIFSSEYEEFGSLEITNTLYTEYHSQYISALYNIKRRSYSINSYDVPLSVINSIKLNDVIKIGVGYYRIDKIKTNINTGQITLKLFNI